MSTAVEVDQWLQADLCLDISLLLSLLELLVGGVEAGNVCSVVLGVVELHDLAGDGWLKRAIVVCNIVSVTSLPDYTKMGDPRLTCEIWKSGLAANKGGRCDTGSSLSVTSSLHGGAESWCGAGDGERHDVCYVLGILS